MTESEIAELEKLRAWREKARANGRKQGKASALIEPCPKCHTPLNARQRRAGCACGQRWPQTRAARRKATKKRARILASPPR